MPLRGRNVFKTKFKSSCTQQLTLEHLLLLIFTRQNPPFFKREFGPLNNDQYCYGWVFHNIPLIGQGDDKHISPSPKLWCMFFLVYSSSCSSSSSSSVTLGFV